MRFFVLIFSIFIFQIAVAQQKKPGCDSVHTVNMLKPVIDSVQRGAFISWQITQTQDTVLYYEGGLQRWLKFTVPFDTLLVFTITPYDTKVDLDFILFRSSGGDFCGNLKTGNVSMLRACLSQPAEDFTTGMTYRATGIAIPAGPGLAHIRPVRVRKGETFYLLVEYGLEAYGYLPQDARFRICFFESCHPESITLRNLLFETASATLLPESNKILDSAYALLEKRNFPAIRIVGHTDNVGTDEYNLDLSFKRSRAVYDYFIAKGYPAAKMSFNGMGCRQPMSFNDTEEGRRLNRRVEIEFVEQ
ncbi:MAG TPA: OmpA family protein [Bacteroidia bacterium]|nr:OmpA family protein [Bacteroidia bacterium]